MESDFAKPDYFLNRELSWLEFNQRVLEEAQDQTQPLLERVKFVAITSSNLDEFFEVRVAGIKQQIENEASDVGPDSLSASETFDSIQLRAHQIVEDQYRLWNTEIIPDLAKHHIHFHDIEKLTGAAGEWAVRFYREEVHPVLTPLAVDSSHPFPELLNKSHNLIVLLRNPANPGGVSYGIVQIPRTIQRLVRIPPGLIDEKGWHFFFLKDLIKFCVGELFPGLKVQESHAFRVTRNSDLYIDDEEAENLLRTIEEELRKRNRGNAVRLEVQSDCPAGVRQLLLDEFHLAEKDLYVVEGPLTFLHLNMLVSNDSFPQLRDKPFIPATSRAFPPEANMFEVLRRQDVLLHHPYETFNSVVEFVQRAAEDPHVLAIKMTLYRTSGDSPIIRALIRAAELGKQVTTLIELKARFDEANNITWAKKMEEAGVHVVYGVVGLKIHCKLLLIVRRDEDGIRHYAHLGTGNYHPSTARTYTDLALLTTRADLTSEVATLFNTLTGMSSFSGITRLIVAPFVMRKTFQELISTETSLAREGKPGRIIAKMNSLVDEEIIASLYEASCAGVKIDLIIRGICCLRPGVPGVSENIRVISIVGRFLEHSRIYYFGNNGAARIYLGSADWMPRNFERRIEVVFPVEDPRLHARISDEILPVLLQDRVKARQLQPDGSWVRLTSEPGAPLVQAQLTFREIARGQYSRITPSEDSALRLTPLASAPGLNGL